jgi:peptidoglycan/LPS O-acetylase OafA/YrhL
MTRRLDVQGIRAVAVGLVILGHAGVPWLGGGFIGVDVFFVVSGFLITSLLISGAAASGRVRLVAFYARRARRILPAATVVLVATTLYSAAVLSAARVERVADDALWSVFFAATCTLPRSEPTTSRRDGPHRPCSTSGHLRYRSSSTWCGPVRSRSSC